MTSSVFEPGRLISDPPILQRQQTIAGPKRRIRVHQCRDIDTTLVGQSNNDPEENLHKKSLARPEVRSSGVRRPTRSFTVGATHRLSGQGLSEEIASLIRTRTAQIRRELEKEMKTSVENLPLQDKVR
ncbi:unnamed protein product [Protopolystoma xenopodis]|uniref:Uncharacterized protein n=1 Tax=Protopolystoma xenopodis TaxID=117903 RepID=A0A448X5C8_9PLAT|nr:unnamed protein product [Protopolystoma xenopodis]